MCDFEDYKVISAYSRQQAIEDGILTEVFDEYTMKNLAKFTNGKKIVATVHLADKVKANGLRDIWNEFAIWKQDIEPGLKEEDRLFSTIVNKERVWVIEDDEAYTLMYPEDY